MKEETKLQVWPGCGHDLAADSCIPAWLLPTQQGSVLSGKTLSGDSGFYYGICFTMAARGRGHLTFPQLAPCFLNQLIMETEQTGRQSHRPINKSRKETRRPEKLELTQIQVYFKNLNTHTHTHLLKQIFHSWQSVWGHGKDGVIISESKRLEFKFQFSH